MPKENKEAVESPQVPAKNENEHVKSVGNKRTGEHPVRGLFWNCSFEALHKVYMINDKFENN